MARLDDIENELKELRTQVDANPKKKKEYKLPWKTRSLLKQGPKNPDKVVVMYLTQKYEVRWYLSKIISGNLIIINNKVHVLNPKCLFRFGKNSFYVFREIDRKPVSNLDYNKVKKRQDDTDSDVPLIKAVLGAIAKKEGLKVSKNIWIILAILAVVGVALFIFFGG